jgi:hypothetical protein
VYLLDGGKPEGLFALAGSASPLEARLSSTHVGQEVVIDYHLVRGGSEAAHVSETPHVVSVAFGAGLLRSLVLVGGRERVRLALKDATQGPGAELLARETAHNDTFQGQAHYFASVRKLAGGEVEFHALGLPKSGWTRQDGVVVLELAPGARFEVELGTVPIAAWNDSVQKQVENALR